MGQGSRGTHPPTDTGGPPEAPPPDLDGVATDEGPMRRELRRQITRLEQENTRFTSDNCPWEPIPTSPRRGPSVLSNEELERIRDELIEARASLHDRTVERATQAPEERPRLRDRLRALLRRR